MRCVMMVGVNMKSVLLAGVLLWGLCSGALARSDVDAALLTDDEINSIFGDEARSSLGIDFPILKAWRYADKSGKHYLVLTEREYDKREGGALYDAIKAFSVGVGKSGLTRDWLVKDFVEIADQERSIWFWTKYIDIGDYDGDGLVDPILVYGTSGVNDLEDGRVKIIIYYKQKKVAVRHQNSIDDYGRHTKVDKQFYELPEPLQDRVKEIMHRMEQDENTVFPAYKQGMNQRKTFID